MKYQHWFFDLDGTLARTGEDIVSAWKAALAALGRDLASFDRVFRIGPTFEKVVYELYDDATPQLVEDAVSETVAKREDALAKRLEAQSKKKGKLIDPLMYAEQIGSFDLKQSVPNGIVANDRPTMQQVEQLEQLGFACPGSARAASACAYRAGRRALR